MNEMEIKEREINLLQAVKGEEKRDAAGSIRGFEYQNLIAVEELLHEDTEYVCCEFLEDVTTIKNDNTCRMIQAKYYTSKLPEGMQKEVFLEMYCEFLKLRTKNFYKSYSIDPVLNVFVPGKYWDEGSTDDTNSPIIKPNRNDVDEWVNGVSCTQKLSSLNDLKSLNLNKEQRQDSVIATYGTRVQLDDYYKKYKVEPQKIEFKEYRKQLGSDLVQQIEKEYGTILEGIEKNSKEEIILGLAYNRVLQTFDRFIKRKKDGKEYKKVQVESGEEKLSRRRISRIDFLKQLAETMKKTDETTIELYGESVVQSSYYNILDNNEELDEKRIYILETIKDNTSIWMKELLSTPKGQYKLVNTVSTKKKSELDGFLFKNMEARREMIIASENGIDTFLRYLWKVMMNLYIRKYGCMLDGEEQMLDPRCYLDDTMSEYISVSFPNDYAQNGVIFSDYNSKNRRELICNYYERVYKGRPQKWYWSGYQTDLGTDPKNGYRGTYDYQYNVVDIRKNKKLISSIQKDENTFWIECMDCIDVDMDGWLENEDCTICIFSENCKHGG